MITRGHFTAGIGKTLVLAAFFSLNWLETPANASVSVPVSFSVPLSLPAPVSVQDDAGKTVVLTSPAKRIIALAPSLTELAYAAGAGAKLVAVSSYSDFPTEAKKLPQVADFSGVSFELLLTLKPDLVLAWKSGNREKDLQRLRDLDIPVYAAEVVKMADVPRVLRDIGKLAGSGEASEMAASQFELRSLLLQKSNAAKRKISVFFELGESPLMTINGNHAISEAITLCGGENIWKAAPSLVFTPSREAMVAMQPQVILYPTSAKQSGKTEARRSSYEGIQAAREKQIYGIDADYILRQGPRFIDGVAEVCDALDGARRSIKK